MSLCYNCGNTMEPGLQFCTECGTAAPRAPEVAPQPPAPSQWDSTLAAGAPPLPAFDDFPATEITPASRPKNRKLPLIIVGVGVLVIAAAVLLLVLKPFSNKPPALGAIEASQLIVHPGDGVTLTARATDPNDDELTYKWIASAGQVIGDGPSVTLSTAGVDASSGRADVKVRLTVSDGRGGTASADQIISVTPPIFAGPAPPPIPPGEFGVKLEADQRSVRAGETVTLTATVSNRDPDEVAYEWKTSAGTVRTGGRSATLETSGIQLTGSARQISVTVTVKDAGGAVASDTAAVSVAAAAPSNWPPTISLRANKTSVQQGEDVEISANATDRDGDPLTYSWNVAGEQLSGGGNRVTLRTAGSNPGNVEVSATVSDGRGESATDRVAITVVPRANHSPTISSVDPDRTRARVGERVSVSARAADPDNDELRYSWTSSAGTIRGSGSTVTLDTSGIEPDSGSTQVRLTVTVNDQRGGVATDSGFVTVTGEQRRPEPVPQPRALSVSQAMEGEVLIVTITGSPSATGASSGSIEVTAGAAGAQVSGTWPPGACRTPLPVGLQNADRATFAETPLRSNGYSRIVVRLRPKNSRQPVRFRILWQAI